MNASLLNDLNALPDLLDKVKSFSIEHLENLNELPVAIDNVITNLPSLPLHGLGTATTQNIFKEAFYSNIVASPGSRYWGFVTGGSTPAAIAGDWLTSVFDQNTQNITGFGDASASLELHTIKLLLELFSLPDEFIGAMVTGATMSNFTGLAVARQWLGQQLGVDIARNGVIPNLKIYTATPHSSAIKSLAMLGIGSANIHLVPAKEDRECIDMAALVNLLKQNPEEPFILLASAGTVNTVDYDDLSAIAALKKDYNFWWHIDAAFGAFAACSASYKHLLDGWVKADSITIDCHKWLNVPYDSAVIFTRKEHADLQVQTFQNSNAPYLGNPSEEFNYLNFGPENSRRFRALPVWFTLMAYGKEGYRDIVENNIYLAQELGRRIEELEGYQLAAPVRLNTVCFTVNDENKENRIQAVLKALTKSGKLFITPTMYKGTFCLRAALVNWRTSEEDIDIAINELQLAYSAATQLLSFNTQQQ